MEQRDKAVSSVRRMVKWPQNVVEAGWRVVCCGLPGCLVMAARGVHDRRKEGGFFQIPPQTAQLACPKEVASIQHQQQGTICPDGEWIIKGPRENRSASSPMFTPANAIEILVACESKKPCGDVLDPSLHPHMLTLLSSRGRAAPSLPANRQPPYWYSGRA